MFLDRCWNKKKKYNTYKEGEKTVLSRCQGTSKYMNIHVFDSAWTIVQEIKLLSFAFLTQEE
jgi:hypothetical protein